MGTATLVTQDWIEDEGWRLDVYRDSGGIPTVCAGHTGPDVRIGDRWTVERCEAAAVDDIVRHGQPVLRWLHDPTPGEIAAWVGFAGNVGVGAFQSSTALRLQRMGERRQACEQLLRWVYITVDGQKVDCRTAGRLCPGLPERRERQLVRCMSDTDFLSAMGFE